jgi:integrating conjugative element protein (TIGR03756 family)
MTMTSTTTWSQRIRLQLVGLVLCICSLAPIQGQAGTTTAGILNSTIQAMPACLRYEVRGVCFFLTCTLFGCWISTSVRVRHYVPDAIVSTYNDPLQHPWAEVGKPLAQAMASVGSALVGSMVDSSANTARHGREEITFKSVDVIGNPVGMLSSSLGGGSLPGLPSKFSVPSTQELMAFGSQELPNIRAMWQSVPAQTGNTMLDAARQTAQAPAALLNKINSVATQIRNVNSAVGPVREVLNGSVDASQIGVAAGNMVGVDVSALRQLGQSIVSLGSLGGGSASVLCPGAASAFTLHYQSDLDGLFWRGIVPLELLYPMSWLPGSADVSQGNAAISTWGGRYPRTGELVQSNPVKASAVYAERAASIVRKPAQPHIYRRLQAGALSGYVVFESQGAPDWQMVYPRSSPDCMQFGQNDALAMSSFGDGNTTGEAGYIWNLWQRYDCCSRAGAMYLYSVP